MRRLLLAGLVWIMSVLPAPADALDLGLSELDQLRRGAKTDFTELERRAEKLLERHKDLASRPVRGTPCLILDAVSDLR
jgi:hypothetical protein